MEELLKNNDVTNTITTNIIKNKPIKPKKPPILVPSLGDSSPKAGNGIRKFSSMRDKTKDIFIVNAFDKHNKPVTIKFQTQESLLTFLEMGKIRLKSD